MLRAKKQVFGRLKSIPILLADTQVSESHKARPLLAGVTQSNCPP